MIVTSTDGFRAVANGDESLILAAEKKQLWGLKKKTRRLSVKSRTNLGGLDYLNINIEREWRTPPTPNNKKQMEQRIMGVLGK